ncbi:hypothetical protein [Halanaerobaculum tunisiense]
MLKLIDFFTSKLINLILYLLIVSSLLAVVYSIYQIIIEANSWQQLTKTINNLINQVPRLNSYSNQFYNFFNPL